MSQDLLISAPYRHEGYTFYHHELERPWNPEDPASSKFMLYAREIVPAGGENLPYLVYLQGGPGFPAPRPDSISGLLAEALKHYRVILLDQRGTGRSSRIDMASDSSLHRFEVISCLRQEFIVQDAEALRQHLGVNRWNLFGQSFGGFCITSYLSLYPESVDRVYLTGGLPALNRGADEVYQATFEKLRYRHEEFYRQVPWAEQRIREVCHHLDQHAELLPSGERLSSRRFRTIGINLGRGSGFQQLAFLLEDPFHQVAGEKRLKRDFLASVGAMVSFEQGPLYAVIHESIYGGVGGQEVTGWSAQRISNSLEGFAEDADPQADAPFYLTGEHIFPWQFEEDPALRGFREVAEELAQHRWMQSPYDAARLSDGPAAVVGAATVYLDDIFVPFEFSMDTARQFGDLRLDVTNRFQHDGIRHDGAGIFGHMHSLIVAR